MTLAYHSEYSRSEKVADGVVHILGLAFALGAAVALAARMAQGTPLGAAIGLGLYGLGILAMLGCSALYNFASPGARKRLFRRLDHAAIFVMIAGTYSPFSLMALHGALGIGLLAAMWSVALGGAAIKMFFPGRFERLSVAVYLLLGWSGLMAIRSLLEAVPAHSLLLLAIGGAIYSTGVVFHLSKRLPFHNAIWHAFVLTAVVCHFFSIAGLSAKT